MAPLFWGRILIRMIRVHLCFVLAQPSHTGLMELARFLQAPPHIAIKRALALISQAPDTAKRF